MPITSAPFGVTKSGVPVTAYTLTNAHGASATILTYAGVIQSVLVPDRNGKRTDVVLGYDDLASYENGTVFLGAFVGRFANRIGGSRFTIDGTEYALTPNENGVNHLHGTYCHTVFAAAVEGESLILTYTSPDGEEGFPGELGVKLTYTMNEQNGLVLDYQAVTDKPTVVNFTCHAYFNLNGADSGRADNAVLQLNASAFTAVDPLCIPTGEIVPVEGTPFDFTVPKPICQDIDADFAQIHMGNGYDHNMVLDLPSLETPCATASSPVTGILLDLYTTQPGVQFYSGNFLLDDAVGVGKGGAPIVRRGAFCLETQNFPDAPNKANFPSAVLRPGEVYHHVTEYRFSVTEEE